MSLSDLFSNLTGAVSQGINTAVGGPFDFTGSLVNAGQTFDPSQFNPATYGGIYGGTDQYGQTAQEVQSTDPGNQLQGTQPQQNQPQQPQAPQAMQPSPGSLLAAIRQMQSPGANPYAIGGGGAVPSVPPGALTPNQAVQQRFGAFAPPATQPAAPAPAPPPQPPPAVTAPATPPAPPEAPPAATRGARRDAAAPTGPRTGTPDPADEETDPAQQAAQQRAQANVPPQIQQIVGNFLRSPMGQLIDRLTGGGISQLLQPQNLSALQQQYGNQVPYGYNRQNMPPWATPQQYQQYLQTGRMPANTNIDPRTAGLAPGFRREPNGQLTYNGRPPDGWTGGQNNRPYWYTDQQNQQGGVFGPPPPAAYGRGQRTTAGTPYLYTTDEAGRPIPKGTNFAGAQPGTEAQLTTPDGRYRTDTLQGRQANIMASTGSYTDLNGNQQRGMSRNAIAGIFANIPDESSWNPSERHPDQPRFRGEAAMSHGLYQEGGDEWPMYQQFLQGRDWRNPDLQTQFMIRRFMMPDRIKAWNAMNNAATPEQAARIFLHSYERPSPENEYRRAARYARGVPSLEGNRYVMAQ